MAPISFSKMVLPYHILNTFIVFLLVMRLQKTHSDRVEFKAKQDFSSTDAVFEFTNIAIEKRLYSQIYIGARNHLYQLSSDLEMLSNPIITGPVRNNVVCNCKRPTQLTDNINKLLLIDHQNNRIITCGSVEEGLCDLRELGNLQRKLNSQSISDVSPSQHVAAPGNLSTVGFLVPSKKRDVHLYVGSSKTEEDIKNYKGYTNYFTISNRTLPIDNLSEDMFKSGDGSAYKIAMKQQYANRNFRITFIDAFFNEITGYFVMHHPSSVDSDESVETSYISQFCLEDWPSMSSYHELSLECNVKGIKYTKAVASQVAEIGSILQRRLHLSSSGDSHSMKVLFISFVQSNGRPGSAVCMFPLQTIEQLFSSTVRQCLNSQTQPTFVSWIQSASAPTCYGGFHVSTPLCRSSFFMWEVVTNLEGQLYSENAIFVSHDTVVTSIAVVRTQDNENTVAFFGTQDGFLEKVRIDSDELESSSAYEKIPINPQSGSTFLRSSSYSSVKKLELGYENNRIYAMTPSMVVGVPVFDCSQYQTCTACLSSNDPFCGWCTLEAKCSSFADCQHSQSSDPFCYIKSGGSCPELASDNRVVLTASQSQKQISLIGKNIPLLHSQYYCRFGEVDRQIATSVQSLPQSGKQLLIDCVSPPRRLIPLFPSGDGHLTLPLMLEYGSGRNSKIIASIDVDIYNCSVYQSCMSCVNSNFDCVWCVEDNMCTYQSQATSYCPQTNVQRINQCPQLEGTDNSNYVWLPEGVKKDLSFPVRNAPAGWRTFTCEIRFDDGQVSRFEGKRNIRGTLITCKKVSGSLPDNKRRASLTVKLTERSRKAVIDNPSNVSVEIYRCRLGKNNESCGACLQSPAPWKCGWCDVKNECSLAHECRPASQWLEDSRHKSCRNPIITGFSPKSAPFGGNSTVVKLRGLNFDLNRKMMVSIGKVRCKIVTSNCCEADCIPFSHSSFSSHVKLCITSDEMKCVPGKDYTALSNDRFHFVDPIISSFNPRKGLIGWGTEVTVHGEHLNTGNDVIINIGEFSCQIVKKAAGELKCRLPCNSNQNKRDLRSTRFSTGTSHNRHRLIARFDGLQRISKNGFFTFDNHVDINNVDPLSTIRSGGLPLDISGHNLGLLSNPKIKVKLNGEEYINTCIKHGRNSLVCKSPDVSSAPLIYRESLIEIFNEGCEHHTLWFNIPLEFIPDPQLDLFDGEERNKVFRNEPIYITGTNLCPNSLHCEMSAVHIVIGHDIHCNVTRLDVDQITCLPAVPDEMGSYPVKVSIGGYSQEIGFLEYTKQESFPDYMYVIFAGSGVFLLLIIIIIVCVYRRRAKASDEELKNVQKQLDTMDGKVAKICKEAFAELQTDMFQLDTHAGGTTIPFLDYPVYLAKVLFPDPATSQTLHDLLLTRDMDKNGTCGSEMKSQGRQNIGMHRFDILIQNKIFLLTFIKALENQNNFHVKDKAKVAGLLMIILHNRLQYATEILEHLLADLINRNMESKNHPKLLLRRTESVAEKMLTHWFTILLHRFLVECAGEPLYTLFRAITQQINKGPLDLYTNEARYSLSEDKLLRQNVEHKDLTLNIINKLPSNQHQFKVKLLNCDSITQAKRKILDVAYLGLGCSKRPAMEDVDLELHQKNASPCYLYDEDSTSEIDSEWKKVNTLDHYLVQTDDSIHLLPRSERSVMEYSIPPAPSRSSLFRPNGTNSRTHHSGADSTMSSLSRYKHNTATLTLHHPAKLWHLVKPNDHDTPEGGDRETKMVSEIYLTRLLITKGTIQKYVDDLFEAIFSVTQRGHTLPLAVKHMFDFLDHQAEIHDITDADVKHTWKSNCLPLRFWVNLIKNPEFVIDVHKSPIADCYLSVIAQAFMDSCSTAQYTLGKDSPSNKLLYAKEIQTYREWAGTYYAEVSNMTKLNAKDVAVFLQEESKKHKDDFNRTAALSQLFIFVETYQQEILQRLNSTPEANRQGLAKKLNDIILFVNGNT